MNPPNLTSHLSSFELRFEERLSAGKEGGEKQYMKSKYTIPVIAVIVIGTVLLVTPAFAETSSTDRTSLIQKIAQKFGIKENELQAVFDEHRQQKHNEMLGRLEDKLNQAVKEGKITEAQKQLILNKHKELAAKHQAEMDKWKNMTPQERRQAKESHKTELEDWAEKNGIDLQYFFRFKGGMGRGHWK